MQPDPRREGEGGVLVERLIFIQGGKSGELQVNRSRGRPHEAGRRDDGCER